MPPATSSCASPALMACAASITACSPEPHTLLMVYAGTVAGTQTGPAARREPPQERADRRAGARDDDGHVLWARHWAAPTGAVVESDRVRISFDTRATNASSATTSCFFPAPRSRMATEFASASRFPITAI